MPNFESIIVYNGIDCDMCVFGRSRCPCLFGWFVFKQTTKISLSKDYCAGHMIRPPLCKLSVHIRVLKFPPCVIMAESTLLQDKHEALCYELELIHFKRVSCLHLRLPSPPPPPPSPHLHPRKTGTRPMDHCSAY